jgi:hypothetical protein
MRACLLREGVESLGNPVRSLALENRYLDATSREATDRLPRSLVGVCTKLFLGKISMALIFLVLRAADAVWELNSLAPAKVRVSRTFTSNIRD